MKNMFVFSIITGGSINFSGPTITKTDYFVCATATLLAAINSLKSMGNQGIVES